MSYKIGRDIIGQRISSGKIVDIDFSKQKDRLKIWKNYQFSIGTPDISVKIHSLSSDKHIRIRNGKYIIVPNEKQRENLIYALNNIRLKKIANPNVKLSRRELKILDSVFQL